jgi:AhpD family alkylhydroperoxidase
MRVDYARVLPAAQTAMLGLEQVVHNSTLEPRIIEIIKLRASQINGCARCVQIHTRAARTFGEDQERLDLVAVWPETPVFTPAERAALRWCESLTLVAERGASDDAYNELATHFEPEQIAALTLAVAAINAWNRLNIGFGVPAHGPPPRHSTTEAVPSAAGPNPGARP